jgi:hypothetical protein
MNHDRDGVESDDMLVNLEGSFAASACSRARFRGAHEQIGGAVEERAK